MEMLSISNKIIKTSSSVFWGPRLPEVKPYHLSASNYYGDTEKVYHFLNDAMLLDMIKTQVQNNEYEHREYIMIIQRFVKDISNLAFTLLHYGRKKSDMYKWKNF